MAKQYSNEEMEQIVDKFKKRSLEELDGIFARGALLSFEEFQGETFGAFLAQNPKNSRLIRWGVKLLFESPFGRWKGKKFRSPFGQEKIGRGVNLFDNKISPERFRFHTYIKPSFYDGKPCLALDYNPYFSLMWGLIDDVREIGNGVLLGQMYYKFPLRKEPRFLGYFILLTIS